MSQGYAIARFLSEQIQDHRTRPSLLVGMPHKIIIYSGGVRCGSTTAACVLALSYEQSILVLSSARAVDQTRRIMRDVARSVSDVATRDLTLRNTYSLRQMLANTYDQPTSLLVTDLPQRVSELDSLYKKVIDIPKSDDFVWVQLGGWMESEPYSTIKKSTTALNKIILHADRARKTAQTILGQKT